MLTSYLKKIKQHSKEYTKYIWLKMFYKICSCFVRAILWHLMYDKIEFKKTLEQANNLFRFSIQINIVDTWAS